MPLEPRDRRLRLAVTGARGRLGSALCQAYGDRHEIIRLPRGMIELSDPETVRKVIDGLEFDVLINTAAYTTVDECERERDLAYAINAHSAAAMAEACRRKDARMIQVSTDFVFDGKSSDLYTEEAATNPINVYGQSKLLGEVKVLSSHWDALVARVSWVFGPDKPAFPEWLITQVRELERVGVPEDKVACPTYTPDFAKVLEPFLDADFPDDGLLHLCNTGAVSYFEYAQYMVSVLRDLGVELALKELYPTRSNEVQNFIAPRPLQTGMSNNRYQQLTGEAIPGWRGAVKRHLEMLFTEDIPAN